VHPQRCFRRPSRDLMPPRFLTRKQVAEELNISMASVTPGYVAASSAPPRSAAETISRRYIELTYVDIERGDRGRVTPACQGERLDEALGRLAGEPYVRSTCSRVEASNSCVVLRVASPRNQRRVAARFSPVQHCSA